MLGFPKVYSQEGKRSNFIAPDVRQRQTEVHDVWRQACISEQLYSRSSTDPCCSVDCGYEDVQIQRPDTAFRLAVRFRLGFIPYYAVD